MIKINLASRKQSSLAGGGGGGGGGEGKGAFAGLGGLGKISFSGGSVRDLPLLRIGLVAVVMYVGYYFENGLKSDELARWDQQLTKVSTEQTKLKGELAKTKGFEDIKKQLESDEKLIRTKIETVQKLITDRQVPPKMLAALSSSIPQDVWIKELHIGDDGVRFKGFSLGFNAISDFMKNLGESAYFVDLKLGSTEQQKDDTGADASVFELTAKRRW